MYLCSYSPAGAGASGWGGGWYLQRPGVGGLDQEGLEALVGYEREAVHRQDVRVAAPDPRHGLVAQLPHLRRKHRVSRGPGAGGQGPEAGGPGGGGPGLGAKDLEP